jgi:cyclohexyl-isocyanide hydratase
MPVTGAASMVAPHMEIGRRQAGLALAAAVVAARPAEAQSGARSVIAMLVHPGMVLLDLVGPMTVFNVMGADVRLVWKDMRPVATDVGLTVQPTALLWKSAWNFDPRAGGIGVEK